MHLLSKPIKQTARKWLKILGLLLGMFKIMLRERCLRALKKPWQDITKWMVVNGLLAFSIQNLRYSRNMEAFNRKDGICLSNGHKLILNNKMKKNTKSTVLRSELSSKT
jgi:hypothetical protein